MLSNSFYYTFYIILNLVVLESQNTNPVLVQENSSFFILTTALHRIVNGTVEFDVHFTIKLVQPPNPLT